MLKTNELRELCARNLISGKFCFLRHNPQNRRRLRFPKKCKSPERERVAAIGERRKSKSLQDVAFPDRIDRQRAFSNQLFGERNFKAGGSMRTVVPGATLFVIQTLEPITLPRPMCVSPPRIVAFA